jgi:NADPH-dependent 2,4-dienoyl-CoA reductase/sulfur reductase-like enzyme
MGVQVSSSKRFLIVGADAAGMSAASEARRADPNMRITAFDRGGFASYSQCGLPYWLGGLIADREQLIARTRKKFMQLGITVLIHHNVTAIDTERGVVEVWDLESGGSTEHPYDHLLIATGASPVAPPLPGLDLTGVFNLDVMEDAIAIRDYLERHEPKRVVVVGGGYIGLEMVENLSRLGLQVHLIELGNQLFPSVDFDLATPLTEELTRHGVDTSLCNSVLQACEGQGGRVKEVTTNQGRVAADMVLLAVGVRPNVELATGAGIELGTTGAIAVDRHLHTNVPNVWAAGDCAEHWHRVLHRPAWIPLGTTANKQGRLVGRNVIGNNDAFAGIVGTAATRIFDVEVARTGLSEQEARKAGYEVVSTNLESTDEAGYMPDAQPLTVKLIAQPGTGRVLGGQAVGRAGASKRIDVLATALFNELDLAALTQLDLAYTPPINSVWDPVQVAATKLLRRERSTKGKEAEA